MTCTYDLLDYLLKIVSIFPFLTDISLTIVNPRTAYPYLCFQAYYKIN